MEGTERKKEKMQNMNRRMEVRINESVTVRNKEGTTEREEKSRNEMKRRRKADKTVKFISRK